jgi:hypothetical protein
MAKRTNPKHRAVLKAKVVLTALVGDKAVAETFGEGDSAKFTRRRA